MSEIPINGSIKNNDSLKTTRNYLEKGHKHTHHAHARRKVHVVSVLKEGGGFDAALTRTPPPFPLGAARTDKSAPGAPPSPPPPSLFCLLLRDMTWHRFAASDGVG